MLDICLESTNTRRVKIKMPLKTSLLVISLAVSLWGCEDKPKANTSKSDAGVVKDQNKMLDPKLAAAIASAAGSSKRPNAKTPADNNDGRPENGVFDPEVADKKQAKGSKVNVEVGSDGADPKWTPPKEQDAWDKLKVSMNIAIMIGRNTAFPSVDLEFTMNPADSGAKKDGKKDAKKDGKKEEKKEDPDATKDKKDDSKQEWIAEITKIGLAKKQSAQVPEDAGKQIAKLKGSKLAFTRDPSGSINNVRTILAKDSMAELGRLVDGVGEGLLLATVPMPTKPVGVGGFWIAGSRSTLSGLEVLTYRMYKVKDIAEDQVTLTVQTTQYAIKGKGSFPGVPPEVELLKFESVSQGEVVIPKTSSLSLESKTSQKHVALFKSPKGNQVVPIQGGVTAEITREKPKVTKKP
jgi:hypothetical protein